MLKKHTSEKYWDKVNLHKILLSSDFFFNIKKTQFDVVEKDPNVTIEG